MVTNIKTLRFCIWNNGPIAGNERYNPQGAKKYASPEEIDKAVNAELANIGKAGGDVIDIRINDAVVDRHNNGGDDCVIRTYTIMYVQTIA